MAQIIFDDNFYESIKSGFKTQTIIKFRADLKAGDSIELVNNKGELIQSAVITDIKAIKIYPNHIQIGIEYSGIDSVLNIDKKNCLFLLKKPANKIEKFAINDGFKSLDDFLEFFSKKYGLPFTGILIKWRLQSLSQETSHD